AYLVIQLRVLRPTIGDAIYRRENLALRDASRAVSPLRDAKALVDVVVALRKRYPHALSPSEVAPLETRLRSKLDRAHSRTHGTPVALRKASRMFKNSRQRLRAMVRRPPSSKQVRKGLRKVYCASPGCISDSKVGWFASFAARMEKEDEVPLQRYRLDKDVRQ